MASKPKVNGKRIGLSLDELNAKFNPNVIIPAKITQGLKTLGEGALPNEEFRKLVGVSTLQLSTFADQFEEYQVTIKDQGRPRTLWCGTAAFAKRVREEIEA